MNDMAIIFKPRKLKEEGQEDKVESCKLNKTY